MALSTSATIEALLFASGDAMPKKQLAKLIDIPIADLHEELKELHEALDGRGLALIETEDEVELRTTPEAASAVKKYRESELSRDLGKASLETLALIMYKDGATRSEVDFVRGVNSTAALRTLLLRGLISRSEDDTDRRKARYAITPEALAHLGLSKIKDLPRYAQFTAILNEKAAEAAVVFDDPNGTE
jgi:segregation and condensation protein B